MDKRDLDQIGQVVEKAVANGFSQIWEHNLEPAINELHSKVDQLPTKSYLDDKLANLEGDLVKKLRKEDDKVNRLTEILRSKNILTDNDVNDLGNLVVFPK